MTGTVSLQNAPDGLEELPPSAKLTYLVLQNIEPATQENLRDHTNLAERTQRYAISTLSDAGYVTADPNYADLRQKFYTTVNQASD